jgi:hypothetical protein
MLPVFVVVPLPMSKREQAAREISETREKAQNFRVFRLFRVLLVLSSHSSPQNPLVPGKLSHIGTIDLSPAISRPGSLTW